MIIPIIHPIITTIAVPSWHEYTKLKDYWLVQKPIIEYDIIIFVIRKR